MARVEFGFMLKQKNKSSHSWQDLIADNHASINALTSGFTSLWVEDHLQWETLDTFECLTTLIYLAAQYPQFKVGTLVLSQSYRNPALVAKMMATLQALSHFRAWCWLEGRRIFLLQLPISDDKSADGAARRGGSNYG